MCYKHHAVWIVGFFPLSVVPRHLLLRIGFQTEKGFNVPGVTHECDYRTRRGREKDLTGTF